MNKKILLVGGVNKTRSLANSLIKKGYKVTAINENYEDCRKLSEVKGLFVIYGDGSKPFVLEDANAYEMDTAIALTRHDDDNLVICELCKKKFNIKKTVALVSDPNKTEFFYKMGVDSVVCAANTIAGIIEQQALMEKMSMFMPIGEGKINIAEVPIPSTSPIVGKKLWEIELPTEVIIGCILRDGHSVIPRGDTRILSGDEIILISSDVKEIEAIRKLTGR